ncbi:MAG: sulfite exporter TauE/SafE family protein [Deltaproteobacteria bacterium]|nr:sulfite exporter TauE/SafE family protein [Deltaproteobacteria bacterium]
MDQQSFLQLAFLGKVMMAFGGGMLSFVSPCVLPLVPSYISFVTGISLEELTDENGVKRLRNVILLNSLMFVLGFSSVFVLILGLSAQIFGHLFIEYRDLVRQIAGVTIVLLGIHVIGIINIGWLQRDKRLHFFRDKPQGFFGSFLVGVGFAAGWTPCIGPILSAIFTVAATSKGPGVGVILFIAYSLGLAIPFLLTSLGINTSLRHFKRLKKHMRLISVLSGIFLIITGVLIFLNSFAIITSYFNAILPSIG